MLNSTLVARHHHNQSIEHIKHTFQLEDDRQEPLKGLTVIRRNSTHRPHDEVSHFEGQIRRIVPVDFGWLLWR